MARSSVTETSPYYPPRARWYSRFLFPLHAARRVLHLEKIHLPGDLSPLHFTLSLALPGFACFALGRRMLGRAIVAAYCLAGLVFIAALGYRAGSIGYGLMISAHATSIVFLQGHWLRDSLFRVKLAVALGTLLAVWLLIYSPLFGFVERHWIMPLRVRDQVVVVWRGIASASVKRGDLVAYEISDAGGYRVYLRAGFGVDRVLAVAGDRVRFTREAVFVNERPFPRAPHMPVEGEFVVPEKMRFIWPTLDVIGGAAAQASVSATMQQAAMVPEHQIIGKPFKHWFWRRQILP